MTRAIDVGKRVTVHDLDLGATGTTDHLFGSVVNRSELMVPSRSAELHDVYG